jgi:hypothetical protein
MRLELTKNEFEELQNLRNVYLHGKYDRYFVFKGEYIIDFSNLKAEKYVIDGQESFWLFGCMSPFKIVDILNILFEQERLKHKLRNLV